MPTIRIIPALIKFQRHSSAITRIKHDMDALRCALENFSAAQSKQDDVIKALRAKVDRLDIASHGE